MATTATVEVDTHEAELGGERVPFRAASMDAVIQRLMAAHPGAGVPTVRRLDGEQLPAPALEHVQDGGEGLVLRSRNVEPASQPRPANEVQEAPRFSSFSGEKVVDQAAKARVDAQHAALKAAGIEKVGEQHGQLFANGTRMARDGYANHAQRKVEHDAKAPVQEVAHKLAERVLAERREDVCMSAAEFAKSLKVNGKITVGGFALGERAIRGLLSRLESPALTYVLGLRERIAREAARGEQRDVLKISQDKARIAETLVHECLVAGDVELKVRRRAQQSDVYAVVSPTYSPADAPQLVDSILAKLPAGAKGSYAYDAATTCWELRAGVWTPTPVAEQAVGEAFEAYVSFRSADDGTSGLSGGGGVTLLACLNASTYAAAAAEVKRRHVGAVLVDVEKVLAKSLAAIDVLCDAWGTAREQAFAVPEELVGKPVSHVLKGLWWGELGDRRRELAGVLPGRTAQHVEKLAAVFETERRVKDQIVRADLGQAWTRYVQDQPAPVRRAAEVAVGDWIVAGRPFAFDGSRVED